MWRRVNGRDVPNERHWSAHASTTPRNARGELVPYTPLPAATGPVWAPDRLSVWPLEGGRYGIDAPYHGLTSMKRAHVQQTWLEKLGLWPHPLRTLAHAPTWPLEAFLGRPC